MVECNNEDVPLRLHTKNRQVDPDFQPEEILYRRYDRKYPFDEFTDGVRVSAAVFIPLSREGDSFNRSLYCESYEDVLINTDPQGKKFINYGVFSILADVIQNCETIKFGGNDVFKLNIIHDPTPCMYPHTVLMISKNDHFDLTSSNKQVNTAFRGELGYHAKLC